jgi:hypothetical protein
MVKGGSPATDFWAGGLRVGDREFVALLDSWLRSEADIPELLRIAVYSRLSPAYQTRRAAVSQTGLPLRSRDGSPSSEAGNALAPW